MLTQMRRWEEALVRGAEEKARTAKGKGSKNRDLHLKHGILDKELEHSFRIKDIIGKPSHEQGGPMPNGKMTVIMTTTFFLEPGVSFCYVSLKIKVWEICWIIKIEMVNE